MMASGGYQPNKQTKGEPKRRSNWQRSVSSDRDDAQSLNSLPSDIRINNWDLSDLRPTNLVDDSKRRKKSKGNPEREREQSLTMDSPPHDKKHHTPSSYPRTKITPSTPTSQRVALENLKQHITFSDLEDQVSTDGERNNERQMSQGRRRLHNTSLNRTDVDNESLGTRDRRTNRNNNMDQSPREQGPDSNEIVARLMQIREFMKQARSMLDSMEKLGDKKKTEDVEKVRRLIRNLQEQEQGYIGLLQNTLAHREDTGNEAAGGEDVIKGESKEDSDTSVDLDVKSENSDTSENSQDSRPRIESKLGIGSNEDEDNDDDDKDNDDEDDDDDDDDVDLHLGDELYSEPIRGATGNSSGNAIAIKAAENENSSSHSHLMAGMPVQESEEGMRGATEIVGDSSTPQQQELLRILREKQQQLQALMSRQEELNLKRRETEKKLLEAQARDNKARAALAAVSTGRQFIESKYQSQLALKRETQAALAESEWGQEDEVREAAGGEDRVLKSNIVGYPVSDDEDNSKVRDVESLPTELLELKRQLNYLRNEFSQVSQAPKNVESESRAVVDGRQQLQNKLQELQDKKSHMDTLLQELQMLHAQPLVNLRNNESSAPVINTQAQAPVSSNIPSQRHPAPPERPQLPAHIQSRMNDMATATPSAVESAMATFALLAREAGRNQESGSVEPEMVSEVQEKLRRLKEVRGQLDELRRLVQYYQGESNEASRDQDDQIPGFSDGGDHAGIKDQASVEIRSSKSSQQQKLQQLINAAQQQQRPPEDASVGASSIDNMVQLLNLAGTDQGDELSDEDNVSASQSESQWSRLGPWDDDPEIQEKVLKLKAAKEKLRQLQDLVAFVQQSPETGRPVSEHLGELAASVEGEGVTQATQTDEPNVSVSEGEVPSERLQQRHSEVEESENPRIELERLKKERAMLLEIQSQLKHIQNQVGRTPRDQGRGVGQTNSELAQTRPEQSANAPVVTFASNDELYSKMRRQRILQEELRSKKKELEAIMKKDRNKRQYSRNQDNQSDTVSLNTDTFGIPASVDATMATWGGSTVDNLENITEDGQERNAGDGDEDDGYPSDGIVQVEEEEEENDSDNGTYTIEADARQRTNTRKGANLGIGARPKTARGRQTYPQPSYNDNNTKTKSQKHNSQRSQNQRDTKLRQENYRSAQELMEDDETTKEKTSEWFCFINERLTTLANSVETLLRKSDTENRQLSVSLNQETAPQTATLISPMQEQMLQLQSQSMMLSFGHVVQTLTRQQVEMQQLQQQMQALQLQIHEIHEHSLHGTSLAPPSSQLLRPALSNPTLNNSNYNLPTALGTHPFSLSQQAGSPYAQSQLNNTATAGLMGGFASPSPGRNFHHSAGLGLSAGNLSGHPDRGQSGYGNGLSINTGSTSSLAQQGAVAGFIFNPLGQSPVNPSTSHTSMTRDFSQFVNTVDAAPSPHGAGFHQFSNHNLFGSSSQQQHAPSAGGFQYLSSQLQGTEEVEGENLAPRLNSYPTGSRNKKRKASNRNNNPGNTQTSGLRMSTPRENSEAIGRGRDLINDYSRTNYEPVSGYDGNTAFDTASSYSSVQSIRDEHTRLRAEQSQIKSADASNDGNTLFETLRGAIYSEVASLISQNESRPQFLLELFRDMQQVDSDQLRQRTLYSLQEVLSSHIKSISGNSSGPSWVRATSNAGDTANSEQTPSESVTSDDEDFKITRLKEKASAGNRLDRITRNPSLRNFPYDFVELADNPSSLSTPTNGCEDSPFFQDTLGETVIEFNSLKQDQEARGLWTNRQGTNTNHSEQGRQTQQVWGAGGFLASEQLLKDMKRRTRSKKSQASGGTSQSSEVTNSSAMEEASQSSFSEMPYPRIDMKQLDRQIKDIMMKTIPVVKEHMDDICSTQLLAYIKRLVLSLTSQIGNQEFARFFQRQLSSLLQDTLQKYHGRKMRECGEDLLVEISDVLFNELAFFRLMQDLDDPNVAEKMRSTQFPTQTSKESSEYSVESSDSEIDDEAKDDEVNKSGKAEENVAAGSDGEPQREFSTARKDPLGQDRNNDERTIEKSEKDYEEKEEDEGEHSYKIELAPSETKPFTRIGSDEDDDDSDEEQSMDDPSETAVSRDSMLESTVGSRVSPKKPEAETTRTAESATVHKSVGEGETTAPTNNNHLPVDSSQMNGITNGNNDEELTVDDLPEILSLPPASSGNTPGLASKFEEEQRVLAGVDGILSLLEGVEELAGDGAASLDPDLFLS